MYSKDVSQKLSFWIAFRVCNSDNVRHVAFGFVSLAYTFREVFYAKISAYFLVVLAKIFPHYGKTLFFVIKVPPLTEYCQFQP